MLSELQRAVLSFVAQEMLHGRINVAAGYAFALYHDLTAAGHAILFNDTILQNRGVPPMDPGFFQDLHALQDFVERVNRIAQPGNAV
jgi:hypothetical protein